MSDGEIMMSDTKVSVLNTIFILQSRFRIKEIQPKNIVNFSLLSHQTIYACLQELVQEDLLHKRCEGKFKYYRITKKGGNILKKARESRHDSVAEPLIKNMANELIEEYPNEFKNISYNIITEYLRKQLKLQLKDVEDSIISSALNYFVNSKDMETK